ncbi:hypothetical protein PSC71_13130 [Devosia sp. J2-20]|uniref:pentapeptide repeat-containing protein n=1 Tax=Devosia sp. J2-20 TaxID=3026161 RepID=UPI00249A2D6B|nr:hypothetical protein [Devosia sp. J2-20]WDQ98171.1 hypothetical protein PSC71_13130 [Devosia sp. J2-20]
MPHKTVAFTLLGTLAGAMLASAAHARWSDVEVQWLGTIGILPLLVATVTLIFLAVNSRYTARSVENTRATLDQARKAEVANRFQKGVELLESTNIATRVGGIAVLRDVAIQEPQGYWTSVADVLANLIESNSRAQISAFDDASRAWLEAENSGWKAPDFGMTGRDVLAAIEVLGLQDKRLRQVILQRDLARPIEIIGAALVGIVLKDLDLRQIHWNGAFASHVTFSGCNLRDATLALPTIRCTFGECDLAGATIKCLGSPWIPNRVSFSRCRALRSQLIMSDDIILQMHQMDLTGARIVGGHANVDFCWFFEHEPSLSVRTQTDIANTVNLAPVGATPRGFKIYRAPPQKSAE